MSKEATLQVRMDADTKERVEALYRGMGTTFAEAVRMFAAQSLIENGMPLQLKGKRRTAASVRGIAAKHANPELISAEEGAYERAMVQKHDGR